MRWCDPGDAVVVHDARIDEWRKGKMSKIDGLMEAFGKEIGIDGLCLDENQWCCLSFDGVVVNMETDQDEENLFLYANLGDLPDGGRERLYEALLEANYFFGGTFGATLSINKDDGVVVLCCQYPVRCLDLTVMVRLVENFINVASDWSHRIARLGPSSAEEQGQAPGPLDGLRA